MNGGQPAQGAARRQRRDRDKAYSAANAHRMGHLSVLAYQDEPTVRVQLASRGSDLKTFSWLSDAPNDTQGFTVADPQGNAFCILRGTESLIDAKTDAKTDADIGVVATGWKTGPEQVPRVSRCARAGLASGRRWPGSGAKVRPDHSAVLGRPQPRSGALRAVQTGVAPLAWRCSRVAAPMTWALQRSKRCEARR